MSSYTVEVKGKYLLTCWWSRERGLIQRLMKQVIFHLEPLFSWGHIYTRAGCRDGSFQYKPPSEEKEVTPSPLGGSGLGGPFLGPGSSSFCWP